MQLQARDKRALIGGAVVVVALLLYLLWPRATIDGGVDLVPADERPAQAAPVQPVSPQTPPTGLMQPIAPANPAQAPAPAQAAAPGTIPEGLKLTGVTASGAIFSFSDGSQRLVRRGREVAPGVTLHVVRLRDVILAAGPTNYRLGFAGTAMPVQAPPQAAPALAQPQPQPQPAAPAVTPPPAPIDRNLFR